MIEEIVDILKKTATYDIVVYDMNEYSPFYQYCIIGSVDSSRQGMAAVNYLKKENIEGTRLHGNPSASSDSWHLVDLGSVVVHIFEKGTRQQYNLDGLFSHLPQNRIPN